MIYCKNIINIASLVSKSQILKGSPHQVGIGFQIRIKMEHKNKLASAFAYIMHQLNAVSRSKQKQLQSKASRRESERDPHREREQERFRFIRIWVVGLLRCMVVLVWTQISHTTVKKRPKNSLLVASILASPLFALTAQPSMSSSSLYVSTPCLFYANNFIIFQL